MRAIKLRILKTSQRIHQLQSHIYARKNLRYSHKKVIDDDEDLKSKDYKIAVHHMIRVAIQII